MTGISQVTCPKCSFEFSVEDVLVRDIEARVRSEFQKIQACEEQRLAERDQELSKREAALRQMQSEVEQTVAQRLSSERPRLAEQVKRELETEYQVQIESLSRENEEQGTRIQELLKTRTENERLKRKLAEREEELRHEYETMHTQQLQEETEKIAAREREKNELKFREKDKLIEQLNQQLTEAQNKIQQGSVQMQGEVQELALEELLRELYPFDAIEEIKKGQKGADVLQEVRNSQGKSCGKIYYESKRTKTFGGDWIEKLREDNRSVGADICVLVTQALPNGVEKMDQIGGVWVCTLEEVKWLSMVLREAVMQVSAVAATQVNKGEKMQMLYDYLTSNEFRGHFEAIVEGFKALQDSYCDEKLRMQKIWKEREKQLEKVLLNAVSFYGAIRGITADAVPAIRMLEGPEDLLQEPKRVVE